MDHNITEQLQDDLKTAMKSGDTVSRDTIRFTLASLKNARIDKGSDLTYSEEIGVLQRDAKRRKESIEQFQAADREDLVTKETAQLEVLERYLPVPLTDEEIQQIVASAIAESGAESPKDLGKVMPLLIARSGGRADGKRLSDAARTALQAGS